LEQTLALYEVYHERVSACDAEAVLNLLTATRGLSGSEPVPPRDADAEPIR
jgi:hypothetical protein